jgi:hypothetical protein
MVQIAPAGVALPLINGATQDFTPRRVNDQLSNRPVRQTDEVDDGSDDQSAAVIVDARRERVEDDRKEKQEDDRFREEQDRRESERRPGNRLDLRV